MKPPPTLQRMLWQRAEAEPDATAFAFEDRAGGLTEFTYGRLLDSALGVAGQLNSLAEPGDRVLLAAYPGPESVSLFFGVLFAGAIPVPLPPPTALRRGGVARWRSATKDAEPVAILCDAIAADLITAAGVDDVPKLSPTIDAGSSREPANVHMGAAEDVAYLQYTSGSTSQPRGVRIGHSHILHHCRTAHETYAMQDDTLFLSWLPCYHDLGLFIGILAPIYHGAPSILQSPLDFLSDPFFWLRGITKHRPTVSTAPGFAYDLCVRRSSAEQLAGLDLSTWRFAGVGAERIRPSTIRNFSREFAAAGFRPDAFSPAYGLAEATLVVSMKPFGQKVNSVWLRTAELGQGRVAFGVPDEAGCHEVMSCGIARSDTRVIVADPVTHVDLGEDAVGEIHVQGPSVADGYWDDASENFRISIDGEPGEWLGTGDIGFLHDSELYVIGRKKDVIIVRGVNYHAEDIEEALEDYRGFRRGCLAAVAVPDTTEDESLGIVAERASADLDDDVVRRECREIVSKRVGLFARHVFLVEPGALPKTSSGKIQRSEALRLLLDADPGCLGSELTDVRKSV